MRSLAILFAIVAVSSAASIMTMDDKEFEKAMMEHMLSQGSLNPMMGFGALMATQHQQHQQPEADVEAVDGEQDAQENEEAVDDQKEVAAVEDDAPPPPVNMFANGMMAMVFPDMTMTAAIPYATNQPNKKPASSSSNNNNQGNGNGKRGGGSAAAASATSFSRGSNSFSSSQAQAFSGGFSQGS